MNNTKKTHLINNEIKQSSVRLPDGIFQTSAALKMAEDAEMDLVCLNPNVTPAICKIMDYQKFLYEAGKKNKNKGQDVKEIKIGPNTSDNDLSYRIKQLGEFLSKGHKVKISMRFKGREVKQLESSQKLMLKMITEVESVGSPEALPKMEGKILFVIMKPKMKK